MEINDIEVEPLTIEPISEVNDYGFEPQARLRANTWPVRPRECATPEEASGSTLPVPETPENTLDEYEESPPKDSNTGLGGKKAGTRRNAWGSLSYADLITKAIDSTADKRLTLSQIYDWMVQNVPYFKDKGDNNSSAGWKNSIRHNLSLHNRFMRVQNEGTGKSSWWVINPDAKPGKTPRRRAASMDPEEMAKKRGRAKKRVEQLRSGDFESYRHNSNPGSEYNSNSDLSSIGGDPFTINPLDIRARTSSNASSFGRLSPIQAGLEPELDDDFGPNWDANGKDFLMAGRHMTSGAESVSEHLAELFMGDPFANAENLKPPAENQLANAFVHNSPAYSNHSSAVGIQPQLRNSFGIARPDGIGTMSSMPSVALPSMNEFGYSNKAAVSGVSLRDLLSDNVSAPQADYSSELKYLQSGVPPNRNLPSPKELAGLTSPGSGGFVPPPSIYISSQHQQAMMARGITSTPLLHQQQQQQLQQFGTNVPAIQQRMPSDSLLQTVQMRGMQQQQQMLRSPSYVKQEPGFPTSPIIAKSEPVSPVSCLPHSPVNNYLGGSRYSGDLTRFVKQEHPANAAGRYVTLNVVTRPPPPPPPMPMDLDFSLQELRASGLECDMDRILQEGNFDLEFQAGISGTYPYS